MFFESQKFDQYTLIEKLGKGGFGEVWLAESANQYFVIKFTFADQTDRRNVIQEIGVWILFGKHPNINSIITAKKYEGQIAIISECASGGSLEEYLRKIHKLSVYETVELTIGILSGLQHLHKNRIIHRDLNPATILLASNTFRLTDFGLPRIVTESENPEIRYKDTEQFLQVLINFRDRYFDFDESPMVEETEIITEKKYIPKIEITDKPEENELSESKPDKIHIDNINLIPYRKENYWGFCDEEKNIGIELKYDDACFFSEGLAMVEIDGKYGLIDKTGRAFFEI